MISHRWDITPRQAMALQERLARLVRQVRLSAKKPIRTVAGVDCAFAAGGKAILTAAVLCDARTWEVLAVATDRRRCAFPYVPGLLSFREAPSVIAAVGALPRRPDLLMCDGQGLAHPRGLGLASHVGLHLGIPTIGVAKSRLCGQHRSVGRRRGCRSALRLESKTIGAVVRTRDGVKPLYVSVGHRIRLDEAVAWTLRAAVAARLPEPTRRAHQAVSCLKARGELISAHRRRGPVA
ncbi:MAG: endonuclease V [Phycisphaerae bacterium]|jgi:deoxyribonuclease V